MGKILYMVQRRTYTDIEYVTGIDIDSQYVVRVYSENKENEYIFKTNDGECVMLRHRSLRHWMI